MTTEIESIRGIEEGDDVTTETPPVAIRPGVFPRVRTLMGWIAVAVAFQLGAELIEWRYPGLEGTRDFFELAAGSTVLGFFVHFVWRSFLSRWIVYGVTVGALLFVASQFLDITDEIPAVAAWPVLGVDSSLHREAQDLLLMGGVLILIGTVLVALYEIAKACETLYAGHQRLAREIDRRKATERALRESDHRFRSLFENFRVPIAVLDTDARPLHVNATAAGYLDRSPESVVGVPIPELLDGGQGIAIESDMRAVIESGEGFEAEYRLDINGTAYWFSVSVEAVRDDNGVTIGAQAIGLDVTGRKAAEEALRQREHDLARAQRIAQIGSYEWDVSGGQVWWSDELYRIFGTTRERLGDPVDAREAMNFLHPDDIEDYDAVVRRKLRDREPIAGTWRIQRPDGTIRHVQGEGDFTLNPDWTIRRYYGTVQDITEWIEAEEARRGLELKMQQAQKLESLGVLAGGIAHDFNNILVGVLGNVGIALEEAPETGELRECLEEMETAARRAADLSQVILAYAGQARFYVEEVDINETILGIEPIVQTSDRGQAAVRFELAETLPSIEADATQLHQIVVNLVTNALEAVEHPQDQVVVRTGSMRCEAEDFQTAALAEDCSPGPYVYVEVEDTGCGIEQPTLDRIFEPFFTTKFTGRGLGLSAVLGIMRAHGGAIHVESQPETGTRVRVLFPLESTAETVAAAEPRPAMPETVLLIDDEEVVRATGERILKRLGVEAVTAEDGRQAVEIVRANPQRFDCAVLDLTMPHMSGAETLTALRGLCPDLPIILCSGYSSHELAEQFEGDSVSGFMQKPYRIQTMQDALARACRPPA